MIRNFKLLVLLAVFGAFLTSPEVHAAKSKKSAKAEKKSDRKPASGGKGFKIKKSGDFTRVIDDEKGITCYFAKTGGGACVKGSR
ncbi:hypothetical protein [Bdellovibrio sp. HCB337]|uniref:hypothetical protein n=1 Tax=Bdellovibrio sp. HCB337 TaxID=3394358 RepID=UPI0039A42D6D